MRKIISRLYVIGMVLLCLYGCKKEAVPAHETETTRPTQTETESQTVSQPEIAEPEPEPEPEPDVPGIRASYVVQTDTSALDESSHISETLYGLFVEDINHALDGGMYPELIKNRSFEYGAIAANTNRHGWMTSDVNKTLTFSIGDGSEDGSSLDDQNPHYAILQNSASEYAGIYNEGFLDGLYLEEGKEYTFSVYLKSPDESISRARIKGIDDKESIFFEETIEGISGQWGKYEFTFTSLLTTKMLPKTKIILEIEQGELWADMISLMPVDTYEGIPVRKDIGEYLEALNPSFLRFPGGCVIEGRDLESMYSWKDSIGNGKSLTIGGTTTVGDVAVRPQGRSIWNGNATNPYYTTYGLGFYEFFLLCEKLDCLPIPILNAGTTCPIHDPNNYIVYDIDSAEFKQCVQDALDLVEFCKGDASTKWGAIRIAMGHEETFDLRYIGIGNEQSSAEYFEHYGKFVEAFEDALKKRPELFTGVQLVIANTAGSGGFAGWDYLRTHPDQVTGMVDEHYYEYPDWFYTSTARYNSYDRNAQAKVFLGEYAGKTNTLEAALSEAAYMTGLEENADVVEMACYAPLFGNKTATQWTPDLLWYSNNQVYGSVSYYVQQMYGNNVGSNILSSTLSMTEMPMESALTGKVGLGTWQTSSAYDNFKVVSNDDGSVLYETTFDDADVLTNDGWEINTGEWEIIDGRLVQNKTGLPANQQTGDSIYIGESTWGNYTLTVDAQILAGSEGFLVPIAVKSVTDSIFWNIGGWTNTVSSLQTVKGNVKSGQVAGTVKNMSFNTGQIYHLKVVVNDDNVKCYIDDVEYVNYTHRSPSPLYETSSIAENGDIILKFVNVGADPYDIDITLADLDMSLYEETAHITILSGDNPNELNSFANPEKMAPVESDLPIEEALAYRCPKYSLSVIRFRAK